MVAACLAKPAVTTCRKSQHTPVLPRYGKNENSTLRPVPCTHCTLQAHRGLCLQDHYSTARGFPIKLVIPANDGIRVVATLSLSRRSSYRSPKKRKKVCVHLPLLFSSFSAMTAASILLISLVSGAMISSSFGTSIDPTMSPPFASVL